VRELQPGLWHWEATHPEWTHDGRPGVVSSYAVDDGERLLLFDPLALPDALLERAAAREPVIVTTCPWHQRDARALAERLGATVTAGSDPPPGLVARPGLEPDDPAIWVESAAALVFGDTLVDLGAGLELAWLREGQSRDDAVALLAPLLELPMTWVLPTHGAPAGRESLERALAARE
jgi:hypothetical protein